MVVNDSQPNTPSPGVSQKTKENKKTYAWEKYIFHLALIEAVDNKPNPLDKLFSPESRHPVPEETLQLREST